MGSWRQFFNNSNLDYRQFYYNSNLDYRQCHDNNFTIFDLREGIIYLDSKLFDKAGVKKESNLCKLWSASYFISATSLLKTLIHFIGNYFFSIKRHENETQQNFSVFSKISYFHSSKRTNLDVSHSVCLLYRPTSRARDAVGLLLYLFYF